MLAARRNRDTYGIAYSQRGAAQYRSLGFPAERIFVALNSATPRPETAPAEPEVIRKGTAEKEGEAEEKPEKGGRPERAEKAEKKEKK